MPEYSSMKYRIPVVDRQAVFLCVKCGEIIHINCESASMDIYESSDGVCESCKEVRHVTAPPTKKARRVK
jgi:predicted RNA-binding Zn-ribbon protein involved in translation (DUF1610 family)